MDEFWHILTDPAHAAAEITFTLLVEVIGAGMIWPFLRRRIRRDITNEHHVIDAEHGVTHHLAPPVSTRPSRVYDHAVDGL